MSNKITDVLVSDSDDILDIACLEENIIDTKEMTRLPQTPAALELVNNIVRTSKEYDFITLMLQPVRLEPINILIQHLI